MKLRTVMLLGMCFAPWLYLALLALGDLRTSMGGFELVPFAALLFAKQIVVRDPRDRTQTESELNSYRATRRGVIGAILLVAAVVGVSSVLRDPGEMPKMWIVVALGLVIATFVLSDIRRVLRIAAEPGST